MGNLLSIPELAEGHRIRQARLAPGEQADEENTITTEAVLLLMRLPSTFPPWGLLGCSIVFSASSGIGVLLRAWQVALARIGRRRSRFRATSLERAKSRLGVPVFPGLTNSLVAHWAADC